MINKKFTMSHHNGRVLQLGSGFSLFGFLVPQFWALVNAQWRILAITQIPFLLVYLANGFQDYCDRTGRTATHQCDLPTDSLTLCAFILQIAMMGICGFRGNWILFRNAQRLGYQLD